MSNVAQINRRRDRDWPYDERAMCLLRAAMSKLNQGADAPAADRQAR